MIRLGREGYRRVQQESRDTAMWLAQEIARLGPFRLISDGGELPVFAFALHDDTGNFSVYDVSQTLRVRGWTVPAYRMPPAIDDLAVLRVCVRNGFSRDLASMLLEDLGRAIERVAAHRPGNEGKRASFHH